MRTEMPEKVPGENWTDHTQVIESMELEGKVSFVEGVETVPYKRTEGVIEEPKWDWMMEDGMGYWVCS